MPGLRSTTGQVGDPSPRRACPASALNAFAMPPRRTYGPAAREKAVRELDERVVVTRVLASYDL